MTEKNRLHLILHGKAAAREDVRAAVAHVRRLGHQVTVSVTWEAGDAQRMAGEAVKAAADDRFDTLVAGGGDGTLNEVVSVAIEAHGLGVPPCAFGLLPLGTANDFGHGIGLPVHNLARCLEIAATAKARAMDVGEVNGRAFVNVATGGFGARVTVETDPKLKKLLGGAAYVFTGLNRFAELAASKGRIAADDFTWSGEFMALAIGNGRQAGGGIELCPEALLDDGALDLTVVPYPNTDEVAPLLRAVIEQGPDVLQNQVIMRKVHSMVIEADEPIQVNLDGEPVHSTRLEVKVHPGRILFRRP